jgi:hypothetical protein
MERRIDPVGAVRAGRGLGGRRSGAVIRWVRALDVEEAGHHERHTPKPHVYVPAWHLLRLGPTALEGAATTTGACRSGEKLAPIEGEARRIHALRRRQALDERPGRRVPGAAVTLAPIFLPLMRLVSRGCNRRRSTTGTTTWLGARSPKAGTEGAREGILRSDQVARHGRGEGPLREPRWVGAGASGDPRSLHVEHRPHLAGQRVEGEGLLQKGDFRRQDSDERWCRLCSPTCRAS